MKIELKINWGWILLFFVVLAVGISLCFWVDKPITTSEKDGAGEVAVFFIAGLLACLYMAFKQRRPKWNPKEKK